MDRIIDVSAGLVFRDGLLLLTQRHQNAHLANLWEFPGGKREPDETFEDCLVRELREELGIESAVHECLHEVTHPYPGKTIHLKFFRCSLVEGEPKAIDCQALAWVTRDQLGDYPFPEADAGLIGHLQENHGLWSI